jgi:hypothetical protein
MHGFTAAAAATIAVVLLVVSECYLYLILRIRH